MVLHHINDKYCYLLWCKMKCSQFLLVFMLFLLSGCSITSPKPSPQTKTNLKETYQEKTVTTPSVPSSNTSTIVTERSYSKEDLSQTTPIFAPQPEPPTFFQRVRNFVIKYSLILGIICFLFPSVAVMILTFILKRTRTAMGQVISGVQDFLDKDDVPINRELKTSLSKKMDVYAKKLVKKLK